MKKIVLIGDSTRMGYDKYVKAALEGVCEVYYAPENGRYATNVLRFAHDWKAKGGWPDDVDLVHWNAGLWDAIELFDDGPLTSYDYYGEAIARVDRRLRLLCPNAKIVFATSTPVLEDKCTYNHKRHNANIEKFNATAISALKDSGTLINDLYATASKFPESYHSDAVHYYTPEGTEYLGGKVLSVICRELGISAADVNIENFEPEKYSTDNIGY